MVEFWTAVAALAASASALVAAVYTWLTLKLVRNQGEPKIVVYASSDPDRQTIIMIRIVNIGRDVATDVRFESSRSIPARAYGLTPETAHEPEAMRDGPLVDGVPVLGPGDAREVTWGQFGGLMKAVGQTPIDVRFTYKHGRRTLKGSSRLEVASFTGTDDSENPTSKIARDTSKIAKALEGIERELKRPHSENQLREYYRRQLFDELPEEKGTERRNEE